ncbi:MAG: MFS transporter, partial [Janthinobacterium lividum]
TSTAYPAALVLIRAATPANRAATAGLGAITVANSTSAALGPVLGGFLVSAAGWQAVFLVNVPICLVGLILGWRVLPRQRPEDAVAARRVLAELDLPGVALFSATMVTLLIGVLSFTSTPHLWLLVVAAVAAVALVLRERSTASPFLDVRALVANRSLTSVLVQQGVVNFVFYCTFFALPLWLERVRGYSSDQAGLFILPVAGLGVLTVPVAARLVRAHGSRAALILGSAVLLVATGALQLLGNATPAVLIVAFGLLLGVPNGFNNLGLQTALYEAAPGGRTGSAGGLFQTSRYFGAISATATIGVLFDRNLSSGSLHELGLLMTGAAVLVLALALLVRRTARA